MQGSHKRSSLISAQLSRFETAKGIRLSKTQIPPAQILAVHDNLLDATEDKVNVTIHFNVRWQKEKDHLVKSMASNLQSYKPTIALTRTQMNRRLQEQTDYHAG